MAACACQIEPGDAQTFAATPTSVEAQYARQRPDFCRFRLGVRSGANASSLMRFGLAQHCEGLRGMVSRHESHLHRGCEGLRHLRGISRKSSHVGDIEKFRKHIAAIETLAQCDPVIDAAQDVQRTPWAAPGGGYSSSFLPMIRQPCQFRYRRRRHFPLECTLTEPSSGSNLVAYVLPRGV